MCLLAFIYYKYNVTLQLPYSQAQTDSIFPSKAFSSSTFISFSPIFLIANNFAKFVSKLARVGFWRTGLLICFPSWNSWCTDSFPEERGSDSVGCNPNRIKNTEMSVLCNRFSSLFCFHNGKGSLRKDHLRPRQYIRKDRIFFHK